ncbi:unnamed protein product [Lymnaea stagnalis]|uniref:C-type lectin domain-containing protein n=1 Tax=Lymnaea stagnalis TaxID=6523 RepID=A0AAV2IFN6_LYMST
MSVSKSVLLLLLMSYYVPVNSQDPCTNKRYGKVPHPESCSKYYECSQYQGKEQTCPSGEHFSAQLRHCVPIGQSSCDTTRTTVTAKRAPTMRRPGSKIQCVPSQENLDLFDRYDYSKKTYFLSKAIFISDVASAAMCKQMCGYLAEVDDEGEYNFVVSLTKKHNYYGILIAGTDKYTEGTWEYERTMKRVKYFNWCLELGEPNNSFDQDCMAISKHYSGMFDHQCVHAHNYYSFRYLCEVDAKN